MKFEFVNTNHLSIWGLAYPFTVDRIFIWLRLVGQGLIYLLSLNVLLYTG